MKVALITGASSGIGRQTAKLFAENGYFVIAQYNTNKSGVDSLIKELEGKCSGSVFGMQANFSDMQSVKDMFENISKSFKHILYRRIISQNRSLLSCLHPISTTPNFGI